MEDQITYPFWFRITPTQIINTHAQRLIKPDPQKSVLIKLSTKEGKVKELNKPIELQVDILYSKTLNKFCPIKGIIKIYDINPDGSEMISCVGSFNTEELMEAGEIAIERDVGHYKVKMLVEVKQMRKACEEQEEKERFSTIINSRVELSSPNPAKDRLCRKNEESSHSNHFMRGNERISEEVDCHETPFIMDDSMDSELMHSQYSEDLRQSEKECLGQQLVEERRNNKALEEKLEKANLKINLLKKSLAQRTTEIKSYVTQFKNFTSNLESDTHGQYIFEINERRRELSLRYRANTGFRESFEFFLTFMTKKIKESGSSANTLDVGVEKAAKDMEDSCKLLIQKMEEEESEKLKMLEENKKLTEEITHLTRELAKNAKEMDLLHKNVNQLLQDREREESKRKTNIANQSATNKDLQFTLVKKNDEMKSLESKLRKMTEENKSLEGMNQYLQEKDTHMESIISSKENTIEQLKRIVNESTAELDTMIAKNAKLQKQISNFECTFEELREENANLLETIEEYREKYGDLKVAKDKALERELRDCLRWIEQQNRDEELNFEENTLSFTDTHNMTSIMKGIENMPLEEISVIRKEVVNVLKKLDELIARNTM